jgi:hypothetical protein
VIRISYTTYRGHAVSFIDTPDMLSVRLRDIARARGREASWEYVK